MKITHFLHVFAGGLWRPAIEDHFDALTRSGFADACPTMYVGMVGTPEQRFDCWEYLETQSPIPVHLRAQADEGWEQHTLQAMVNHLLVDDSYVWYSHTKGAWDASEINIAWRKSMEHDLFDRWEEVRDRLDEGYDVVGPHMIPVVHGGPFAGGNYFAASGRHIRLQPPLCWDTRHNAENWIGLRPDANLYDLRMGWPGFGCFHPAEPQHGRFVR